MKKLKRILAICLMVFYVCVLSACGKNNSNMNNNDMADQTQSAEDTNPGNSTATTRPAESGSNVDNGSMNGNAGNNSVTDGNDNTGNGNAIGDAVNDAGNTVGDVIEDVGDGVKDITDDVTGTGSNTRTR